MRHSDSRRLCALLQAGLTIMMTTVIMAPAAAAGQSGETDPAPMTSWGDPDLQGVWTHGTITPLERPAEYAGRELLTEGEVAALNHASDTRAEQREGLSAEQDVALAYN